MTAQQHERQGWDVKADLPGHKRPAPIGKDKRVPDVEALKRGRRRIVEIETPEKVKADKGQHATFRRHAAHKENTKFRIEVAK